MSKKLGIALCGGGARGWAHIGVLRALEENGISPDFVAGASAGAIVGALYAGGKTANEMMEIAGETSLFQVFRAGLNLKSIIGGGISDLSIIKEIIKERLGLDHFGVLKKDLFISVTNLNTGNCEIISDGVLSEAVMASAAIPLIFQPIRIKEDNYVDGGLINNLPVEPLKKVADCIIGVNINPHGFKANVENILQVGVRTFDLIVWKNTESRLEMCDVIIEPEAAFNYGLFDFDKAHELYEIGYKHTLTQIPKILEYIC